METTVSIAIVTDGETWFGLQGSQIMILSPSEYEALCEGARIREITPEKILCVEEVDQCPGCGKVGGPCPNAECVRPLPDPGGAKWR